MSKITYFSKDMLDLYTHYSVSHSGYQIEVFFKDTYLGRTLVYKMAVGHTLFEVALNELKDHFGEPRTFNEVQKGNNDE